MSGRNERQAVATLVVLRQAFPESVPASDLRRQVATMTGRGSGWDAFNSWVALLCDRGLATERHTAVRTICAAPPPKGTPKSDWQSVSTVRADVGSRGLV